MNLVNIKNQFPIFSKKINNKNLIYLDSSNSSQKPKLVIDRLNSFYSNEFSNVGRSVHALAVAATNNYENTRVSVQKYLNAKYKEEIVFTKGATEAINLVASTYGQKYLKEGDEVLITELEHHSNYVPWHYLRNLKKVKIEFAEIDENGDISLESIKKKINSNTKIICITHISNVTGAVLPVKEITREMRSRSKEVNFGLIYRMGADKLSIVTKTSKEEAKEFIERFFQKYNTIHALQENFLEKARKEGFAETLFGRRRYLPDINKKGLLRNLSEGAAINTPIQGSAADLIKLAMSNIYQAISEQNLKTQMILQVHDELLFDLHNNEKEMVVSLVIEKMQTALPMSVPIEVEIGIGRNWLEAH